MFWFQLRPIRPAVAGSVSSVVKIKEVSDRGNLPQKNTKERRETFYTDSANWR
jgi:hypothetical protein